MNRRWLSELSYEHLEDAPELGADRFHLVQHVDAPAAHQPPQRMSIRWSIVI